MSNISIVKRGFAVLAIGWLAISPLSSAWATDVTYNTWLDSIKFGGDLRLRHDGMYTTTGGTPATTQASNRDRERFRLRYGFNAAAGDLTTIFRMSTSADTIGNTAPKTSAVNADGLSANQTEDNSFARKPLSVDLAYIKYKPLEIITVQGGKMDNPFWDGWSSSLMWDPDLNPEGYAQLFNLPLGIYLNMGQFSINEDGSFHDANPWMFAERLGVNIPVGDEMKGSLSATDYGFTHEKQFPLNGDLKQGNTRTAVAVGVLPANTLTSSFNILQLDGKFKLRVIDIPVALEGGFVRNTEESVNKGRDGSIFGLTLGNASKAKTWEVAYYHKALGANAVIADFVDDDFGYGGTNQAGHIFWVGYAPRENVLLKAMYYNTHILDTTLSASAPYINHLMLDVVIKI